MSDFEDKLQSILGNPEAMGQIMSLAQSITGSTQDSEYPQDTEEFPSSTSSDGQSLGDLFSILENLDPRLLQIGMRLISEYNSNDDQKRALLVALQPFIHEKRYAKVDKAIQIAKLAHVIRIALDSFRIGGEDDV